MQTRRHVFILVGDPKTGKSILGNLVNCSLSTLVLDDFVIPEKKADVSQHLISELDSKDPFWRDKLTNDPLFTLMIIINGYECEEVMNLIETIYPTLFKGVEPNIPITLLRAEDGDFYL